MLRRTGDPEAARWAGAEFIVAALDVDAAASTHVDKTRKRRLGQTPPLTLAGPARQRESNDNEALDRAIESILRDELPPFEDSR